MKTIKTDKKDCIEKEFNVLKCLDNPFLIKLIGDDFYLHDYFCYFLTEFYEVIHIFLF